MNPIKQRLKEAFENWFGYEGANTYTQDEWYQMSVQERATISAEYVYTFLISEDCSEHERSE